MLDSSGCMFTGWRCFSTLS